MDKSDKDFLERRLGLEFDKEIECCIWFYTESVERESDFYIYGDANELVTMLGFIEVAVQDKYTKKDFLYTEDKDKMEFYAKIDRDNNFELNECCSYDYMKRSLVYFKETLHESLKENSSKGQQCDM